MSNKQRSRNQQKCHVSRRNSFELQPADILLTTLLAKDMFPSRNGLKDLFTPTPSLPDQKRKESGATDPPDWSEDNMETPSSPPASSGREERSDENEEVLKRHRRDLNVWIIRERERERWGGDKEEGRSE